MPKKNSTKESRDRKRRRGTRARSLNDKKHLYSASDILQAIAEAFGVTVEHIVVDDTGRVAIRVQNKDLFKRFLDLDRFSPQDLENLIDVLDVYIQVHSAKATFKDS